MITSTRTYIQNFKTHLGNKSYKKKAHIFENVLAEQLRNPSRISYVHL